MGYGAPIYIDAHTPEHIIKRMKDKNELETMLGAARFKTYYTAAGNDTEKAVALYRWNTRLAGALHSQLSYFEVLTRNAMNDEVPWGLFLSIYLDCHYFPGLILLPQHPFNVDRGSVFQTSVEPGFIPPIHPPKTSRFSSPQHHPSPGMDQLLFKRTRVVGVIILLKTKIQSINSVLSS